MAKRLRTPPHAFPLALGLLRPGRRPASGSEAPRLSLRIDEVDVRAQDLESWRVTCGYGAGHAVPLPYLFVLGFRSLAALLIDRSFPLSPLGMVHIASTLELFEPIRAGDLLSLELELLGWRSVRLGREVEIETRYFKAGKEVARGRQISLGRGGGTGEKKNQGERSGPPDTDFEMWRLGPETGRRYARVSGDWNPIHLWPLTALPFGYRRPIAHGMYLVARACANLDPRGEDLGRRLEVRFKTPAHLPGRVRFYARPKQGEAAAEPAGAFELWRGDGSRPHVIGRLTDR